MNRSVERPPSRFRALRERHGAGDSAARAALRFASEHEDVMPIHQRLPPSVRRMDRRADLFASRPLIASPFSKSSGPAWMSSRAPEAWDWLLRRKIVSAPDAFSAKMPLPREDAEFHAPLLCPSETTRPRGFPSGVKNPALMASSAPCLSATDWEVSKTEPGPNGWSMTRRRWVRESKETPSKDIPRIVFLARRG